MREPGHLLRATPKSLDELRIVSGGTVQDLQRNLLVFDAIVRVPHRRHRALTDLAGQEVAVGQHQPDTHLQRRGARGLEGIDRIDRLHFSDGIRLLHRRHQAGRHFGFQRRRWRWQRSHRSWRRRRWRRRRRQRAQVDRQRRRRHRHDGRQRRQHRRRLRNHNVRRQRRNRIRRAVRIRFRPRLSSLLRPVLEPIPQQASLDVSQQQIGLFRSRQRTIKQPRDVRKVRATEQIQLRRQHDLGVDLQTKLLRL